MDETPWQPTNEPSGYDPARVAKLKPVQEAIEDMQLPPIRVRKLNAITNALEMQIEDGGDAPEINNCLLEALRLAVIHQVGGQRGTAVLLAIDEFEQKESLRWNRVRTQTSQPPFVATGDETSEQEQGRSSSRTQSARAKHKYRPKRKKKQRRK